MEKTARNSKSQQGEQKQKELSLTEWPRLVNDKSWKKKVEEIIEEVVETSFSVSMATQGVQEGQKIWWENTELHSKVCIGSSSVAMINKIKT